MAGTGKAPSPRSFEMFSDCIRLCIGIVVPSKQTVTVKRKRKRKFKESDVTHFQVRNAVTDRISSTGFGIVASPAHVCCRGPKTGPGIHPFYRASLEFVPRPRARPLVSRPRPRRGAAVSRRARAPRRSLLAAAPLGSR